MQLVGYIAEIGPAVVVWFDRWEDGRKYSTETSSACFALARQHHQRTLVY